MKFPHYETILLRAEGNVLELKLNRPERLNAINREMRREIIHCLKWIEKNKTFRCLILTGGGKIAFSAGEDLEETAQLSDARRWTVEWIKFLETLMKSRLPVVTASNGYAVGAGLQVFLIGDYRICSGRARFALPEIDVGLPSILGTTMLRLTIGGLGQLGRLSLLGEKIGAKEALSLGLVHEIASKSTVEEKSMKVAQEIAMKPHTALHLQKNWIQRATLKEFRAGVSEAAKIYQSALLSSETRKSISDFFGEERKAS